MSIALRECAFSPYAELERHQESCFAKLSSYGATASFVGTLRDFNEGQEVLAMHLEHYPGMTEKALEEIEAQARQQWHLQEVLLIHRVGDVNPGETLVLVATWSAHRGDALDACRFLMEALKQRAPFWKKETLPDRERWVEHNTNGYAETYGSSD
jgi:molybdopterin synthase catalytic subunit